MALGGAELWIAESLGSEGAAYIYSAYIITLTPEAYPSDSLDLH